MREIVLGNIVHLLDRSRGLKGSAYVLHVIYHYFCAFGELHLSVVSVCELCMIEGAPASSAIVR